MKLLAIALLILALLNAGVAAISNLRGNMYAMTLWKEGYGKLNTLGDAIDYARAADAAEQAWGRRVFEPDCHSLSSWVTEERGAAAIAAHGDIAKLAGFNSVVCAFLGIGTVVVLVRRGKAP